jgi:hypothetical protein
MLVPNLSAQRREHIYHGVEFVPQEFNDRTALAVGALFYRLALVASSCGKRTVLDEAAVLESRYPGIEFGR